MKITPEEIDDFIKAWESAFNERLSREEAEMQANRLVELFELISQPTPNATPTSDPHLVQTSAQAS